MAWSWTAWCLTVGFVCLSGYVSYLEGTLTSRDPKRVHMGFLNHGGMWSDCVILSVVNGLIVPHSRWNPLALVYLTGILAVTLTIFMHWFWWDDWVRRGYTGHMWPLHRYNSWIRDMSIAGWMHVIYMAFQFQLILLYLFFQMPPVAVVVISLLLSVHILVGTIQPGWWATGRWRNKGTIPTLAISLGAIWAAALAKI